MEKCRTADIAFTPGPSTSLVCYAVNCNHSGYKLARWEAETCRVHGVPHHTERCTCPRPFKHFKFPNKRDPERRAAWIGAFNRAETPLSIKNLEPKPGHRVCSAHFIGGQPSALHPDPVLKLGHHNVEAKKDDSERHRRFRKRCKTEEETSKVCDGVVPLSDSPEQNHFPAVEKIEHNIKACEEVAPHSDAPKPNFPVVFQIILWLLLAVIRKLKAENNSLKKELVYLQSQLHLTSQKKTEKQSKTISEQLQRTDADAVFYCDYNRVDVSSKMTQELPRKVFESQKKQSLDGVDLSRKGSIDAPIVELITFINNQPNFFTLSSCSGRICLFEEDPDTEVRKKGCRWLYTSHDPCDVNLVKNALQDSRGNASFKFEPFVLHAQCYRLQDAQLLHAEAVASGFRNSGITVNKKGKIVVAVRSTHSMEVPCTNNGKTLVSEEYLDYIAKLANTKMDENFDRIKRFTSAIQHACAEPGAHTDVHGRHTNCHVTKKRTHSDLKRDKVKIHEEQDMNTDEVASLNDKDKVHRQDSDIDFDVDGCLSMFDEKT